MTDAVIVSTARTGLAKSWRGSLNKAHPVTYTGHVLQHAMERARVDPREVQDVMVGGAFMEGAAGSVTSRVVAHPVIEPRRSDEIPDTNKSDRSRRLQLGGSAVLWNRCR
jgi:acetyl-CoA acetyltransferase